MPSGYSRSRFILVLGYFVFALVPVSVLADTYTDTDWNSGFYNNCDLPCTLPEPGRDVSLNWRSIDGDNKLQVSLMPGDTGGCSSDQLARNGANYWERAEILQMGYLPDGVRSEVRFEVEFTEGFAGKRENFFQIHGWTPDCPSAPLIMAQFDWRALKILILKPDQNAIDPDGSRGHLEDALDRPISLQSLQGRVNKFRVILDRTTNPDHVDFVLNNRFLIEGEPVHTVSCAVPRVKIGIYRPGEVNPETSVALYDDVQIEGGAPDTCEGELLDLGNAPLP